MALTPLQHVQPGQLITSAWANSVIDEINAIIAELESVGSPPNGGPSPGGPPVLTGRSPTGDVQVGDMMTLLGQNFGPRHDGLTRVQFGSQQVTDPQFLLGSSDTQLRFAVPNVNGTVSIRVITPQGMSANVLSVNVSPATLENLGDVQVDPSNDSSNPPTPKEGVPLILHWTIASNTEHPDHYTLNLAFTDVTPVSQVWSGVLNAQEATIAAGSPFTVIATVTVPHEGSAKATLTAQSTTNSQRHQTSIPVTLEVNVETAVSDPRIQLNIADPQPVFDSHGHPSHAHLTFDGEQPVISVDAGQDSFVRINVHFNDPSAVTPVLYRFFAEVDDTTNWTVGDVTPPTLNQSALMGNTSVTYNLTNKATGASPNDATLTVRAAKLKVDGVTDDYVSFAPVTLRNAG